MNEASLLRHERSLLQACRTTTVEADMGEEIAQGVNDSHMARSTQKEGRTARHTLDKISERDGSMSEKHKTDDNKPLLVIIIANPSVF